jgi:copper chaperone CopZ
MKYLMLSLICLSLFSFSSCRKQDIENVAINVPNLNDEVCFHIIENALHKQPGIKSIQPDYQNKQITITYNSMIIAIKNLEFAIAEQGFKANQVPANTNVLSKLPAVCK